MAAMRPATTELLLLEAYGMDSEHAPTPDAAAALAAEVAVTLVGMVVIPGDDTILMLVEGLDDRVRLFAQRCGLHAVRVVPAIWRSAMPSRAAIG